MIQIYQLHFKFFDQLYFRSGRKFKNQIDAISVHIVCLQAA